MSSLQRCQHKIVKIWEMTNLTFLTLKDFVKSRALLIQSQKCIKYSKISPPLKKDVKISQNKHFPSNLGDLVSCMGDWEIPSVSGILLYNLGENFGIHVDNPTQVEKSVCQDVKRSQQPNSQSKNTFIY